MHEGEKNLVVSYHQDLGISKISIHLVLLSHSEQEQWMGDVETELELVLQYILSHLFFPARNLD